MAIQKLDPSAWNEYFRRFSGEMLHQARIDIDETVEDVLTGLEVVHPDGTTEVIELR